MPEELSREPVFVCSKGKRYRTKPGRKTSLTERQQEQIREWARDGRPISMLELARRIGASWYTVQYFIDSERIAHQPKKRANFSAEEIAILERTASMTAWGVQRELAKHGFHRSYSTIKGKRTELMLIAKREGFSRGEVMQFLGVSNALLDKWERLGLLKFRRRDRVSEVTYVSETNLARFMYEHLNEFDHRRVDRHWLRDMWVLGSKGGRDAND